MTAQPLRVGVVFGGRSGEHEVSLRSATSVMRALQAAGYVVVPLAMDREGRWLEGPEALRLLAGEATEQRARPLPPADLLQRLDVVFPVLHGPFGEDGTVQGLLELLDVPYVGCGVLASAIGMDKAASKAIFAAAGLPLVPYLVLKRCDWEAAPEATMDHIEARLAYPMFVKPANLGSSVGVSKAKSRADLARGLRLAARYDRKLIVEQGIEAREIEVSVLGNDRPLASVPGEIVPAREFYDYEAKYVDPNSALLIPAPLPSALAERAQQLAVAAFLAIDGAGMARVDFLLDRRTNELYLNEVNTIPGFTDISMYPKLWEASGLSYPALMERLIALALERAEERRRCATRRLPDEEEA
ncbi:MAG: D-alanine--D-alanine ligase [Caldilineales bacterium]|nr:D-alanine--D-alanine ligase [Caldilineales bacterium]MDW8316303.1 D-alanine--D-alanine ligase family protein [Anaerolineae bacterium]